MRMSKEGAGERRLGPNALIVAYAMSRLDRSLLEALGYGTWQQAFARSSEVLAVPHNSIKLLRDEFDVFFPNGRRVWILRQPHPSRVAVLHEFEAVSNVALLEVVRRILANDQESVHEILGLISAPTVRVANVAERLLTGRRAEEHFISSCQEIIKVPSDSLTDRRHAACGFDFETAHLPGIALEVKGLKAVNGGVLFTEREWTEAQSRGTDYWVVVVGNLSVEPIVRVFNDPVRQFDARCRVVKSASTAWSAEVSVL